MIRVIDGEKELLSLTPVSLLVYKWITGSFYWRKKIIVTNKRLIISFQWFGFESFTGSMSCYYIQKEYEKYKTINDSIIINHEIGKGKIFGDYLKLTVKKLFKSKIKIYTHENHRIEHIIKKTQLRNSFKATPKK